LIHSMLPHTSSSDRSMSMRLVSSGTRGAGARGAREPRRERTTEGQRV
jgi:hypothetical protein